MNPSPGDRDETVRLSSDKPFTPRHREDEAQFAPGTIIAGRYRIASILGSGGMGEVFRAEDTKLGQTVALKFLPAQLARNSMLLDRLHEEVRLGRQITHPNVCRIYDISEDGDAHFIAMEYIDGEDLSRLLKRIGRLPHDKAGEVARGIAAGLAAAHGKGILHRDLKPSNVMIDSRGDARIMDFGLAHGGGGDDRIKSGTPAYMAPEQFAGDPASVQSDLYALGLVMYELFTGRTAHKARTMPERLRDMTNEITTPSIHIRDIDPTVERIILRCLANEPADRPRDAREVLNALPGGNPLEAALAAGETPSPRVVAAAGTAGTLSRTIAWILLSAIALCLAVLVVGRNRLSLSHYVSIDRDPAVLMEHTAATLRGLGIPEQRYESHEHVTRHEYFAWLFADRSQGRWERLRKGPPVITFRSVEGAAPQPPNQGDEIIMRPGTTDAQVDLKGRLFELTVMPGKEWRVRKLDWIPLMASAGLNPENLSPTEPRLVPPIPFDSHVAWSGKYLDGLTPIHVEAAAWRGTPVFLRITGAWESASVESVPFSLEARRVSSAVLMSSAVLIGCFLAWRNFRQGRGDRRGALRIAIAVFALGLSFRLLVGPHQPSGLHELELLQRSLADALLLSAIVYILYLALEPFVRRRWPEHLIASTRLLSGNANDPMVGRDVLIGVLAGAGHSALIASSQLTEAMSSGVSNVPPFVGSFIAVSGFRFGLGQIFGAFSAGILQGFVMVVVLVTFALLLRMRLLAAFGLAGTFLVLYAFIATVSPWVMLITAVMVFVVARYGLLAAAVAQSTFQCLIRYPLFGGASWYSINPLPLIVILALALWAFRTSLGGQSAFAGTLLDD